MKRLIVLDLDETLVHTTPTVHTHLERIGTYRVFASVDIIYKRPHLDKFLQFAFDQFQVGIWTAASEDYAKYILSKILKESQVPLFVFSSNRCTQRINYENITTRDSSADAVVMIKRLSKVRRTYKIARDDILVVDDKKHTFRENTGNGIQVIAFEGQKDDKELLLLIDYLKTLLPLPQWSRIEKRYWHTIDAFPTLKPNDDDNEDSSNKSSKEEKPS